MTILEPDPIVVSPAPVVDAPPVVVAPVEPELVVIRRRRRRAPFVAAAAALVAMAVALVAWAPWSSPAGPSAPTPTQPPTYVQLTSVSAHSIALRWSAPLTDASVVGYEIVRDGAVGDVLMPMQSTYVATGLASGRTYRFEVVAIYAHSVSAPSTQIVTTTSS